MVHEVRDVVAQGRSGLRPEQRRLVRAPALAFAGRAPWWRLARATTLVGCVVVRRRLRRLLLLLLRLRLLRRPRRPLAAAASLGPLAHVWHARG